MKSPFESSRQVRRSRKAYSCGWCAQAIELGSAYTRVASVYDGDFWHAKMHDECYHQFFTTCDGEFSPGDAGRGEPYGSRM